VTAAGQTAGSAAPTTTKTTTAKPAAAPTSSTNDDTPSKGLVLVALVLGALGLVAGVVSLVTARRRPAAIR
jgi:uncharacterized protein HemX